MLVVQSIFFIVVTIGDSPKILAILPRPLEAQLNVEFAKRLSHSIPSGGPPFQGLRFLSGRVVAHLSLEIFNRVIRWQRILLKNSLMVGRDSAWPKDFYPSHKIYFFDLFS